MTDLHSVVSSIVHCPHMWHRVKVESFSQAMSLSEAIQVLMKPSLIAGCLAESVLSRKMSLLIASIPSNVEFSNSFHHHKDATIMLSVLHLNIRLWLWNDTFCNDQEWLPDTSLNRFLFSIEKLNSEKRAVRLRNDHLHYEQIRTVFEFFLIREFP